VEGTPRTNPEQDRVLAQSRSSGECQRLKSDIYLSLSVWHSTSITHIPRENLLSEAFSLMILSLTILILRELITLSLCFTLSFGAVATFEFTSLLGAPVTKFDHYRLLLQEPHERLSATRNLGKSATHVVTR